MLVLRYISIYAVLAVFVLPTLFCQHVLGNEEYRTHAELLNELFLDYDKISHPSPDPRTPINVTIGIAVAQLVRVDERMEGMNLNVWYRMKWNDYRLRWDPRKHGNITNFKIDSDYLWTPDIMLYKPLSSEAGQALGVKKHDDDLAWKIGVSSDGTASFNFPGTIDGQCSLTISDYPYDEHKCSFKFSSWVHNGNELVLKLRSSNSLDFDNYVTNNEWHIVGTDAKAITLRYSCCPEPYYLTAFNIHVRRGASSYVSNYIIPSILIAILSIMMFTLPPEVGKRMEIGINLLLCLSVYLTILNTKMPTRSDAFPLLSKFYGCCIFILTCALLCTCWVVAYYFHDMSGWKIYAMPKFVEVGVLRYLRRTLRFPDATKVYPSDILESVNSQRMIEVKPMIKEQTNFAADSPRNSPDGEAEPTEKDTEVVQKENEDKESVEKETNNEEQEADSKEPKKQNENSRKPEDDDRQEDTTKKKDTDSSDVKQNDENQENEVDKEKRKRKKKSKKLGKLESKKDPDDKDELNDPERKEKKRDKKEHRKRAESEGPVEKKRKPSVENQPDETRRESEKSVNIRKARSPSRDSNTSQASKKSNNVFADTVAPGLIEKPRKDKRRKKPKKEDIGVVNLGAEKEEKRDKKTGNKTEKDDKPKEPSDVRESPSLKDKIETAKDTKPNANISAMAKPSISVKQTSVTDQGFDVKQEKHEKQESKKKDESVKLLKELAEYFSDHLERKKNRYQWRQAAVVLNRLFLIILCISITLSIIIVFLAR